MRRLWLWVALLLVAAIAVFWMAGPRRTHAKSPSEPANKSATGKSGKGRGNGPVEVPVAAATIKRGDMPVYQVGLGSVIAYYTVTLHTRVDGEVMNIPVREGDNVKKGQLLAQIDPRPFEVQLEQAQGQMARDQALLSNARLDLQRYETLVQQDAIPKQQLDTQVSTVAQYEGAVKQDQGTIDNAKLQLVYARITAPFDGRIGLRQVDPGNIVHAADTNGLFVLTQLQPIAALFTIPEDNIPPVVQKLKAGAKLPVVAYNRDYSKTLDTGYLETIDNEIDPQTGTSRLKAIFPNRSGVLFPNEFVNIRVLVDTLHNQVIAPAVAIQRGQQATFVYLIKADSTVEVRPVTVGVTADENVVIQSGLEGGESVVVDGADKLEAGSKVRVRPPTAGSQSGGQSH
ncbi:MAG TPA: MdtA/MuxA family multidrug efflux RND transporter periplasmic adaptor subunit [Bryobacteraceae bacterium]|nr:MdtA/MuxA family multidrug efflux RND transporter periplasmic adaptor subunit [Bryobacteraceae bacterium]